MEFSPVDDAIELLEKANSGLAPELLTRDAARRLLDDYTRARRLADFGIAQLARKLDDPGEIARTTGTSMGKAKETVTTGKMLGESHDLSAALKAARSRSIRRLGSRSPRRRRRARPGTSSRSPRRARSPSSPTPPAG
jgi:hypothetical protein